VPVVASNVGGLPEVIQHGVTGFIHPPDALDAMAASALRILTEPGLAAAMGAAARRRVVEQFDAERIVPLYEHYYGDILSHS
jgi:glycosyltransferase involved in cell wall biosynthesis